MDNNKVKIASGSHVKQVREIGAVATLNLPEGFVKGIHEDSSDGHSFKQYILELDPDIKLYFEYRGSRINRKYADQFKELLSKKPHTIDKDEIYKYSPVFIDKSIKEDFKIEEAKTEEINGKNVLVIEGTFLKHDIKARTIYIDTDGSGSAIQEVTFQTTRDKAQKYFPIGIESLRSITWK